jgi:ribosomal RNA small subunit methyltransferase RsmB
MIYLNHEIYGSSRISRVIFGALEYNFIRQLLRMRRPNLVENIATPRCSTAREPLCTRQWDARTATARVLAEVLGKGVSLDAALAPMLEHLSEERERRLAKALCYGTLRWYPRLNALALALLRKGLRTKDMDVYCLILIGLYQLTQSHVPGYAAVAATTAAARKLAKSWATGLINALLRRYQREELRLRPWVEKNLAARYAHPAWLLKRLQGDWPDHWQAIAAAGNRHPPMTVRVNARKGTREDYLQRLGAAGMMARACTHSDVGVVLGQAVDVDKLPGFVVGAVSVQDEAAQLAVPLLNLAPNLRVLDACAAPGGKTTHMLEAQPSLGDVVGLDLDARRLSLATQNLQRLGLNARLVVGDALQSAVWWDEMPFDRILLDAPCSATGVIRRHPDIKVLRSPEDIGALAEHQLALLQALWPLLRRSGMLLYATCSVLAEENERVIGKFLASRHDAGEVPIDAPWGRRRCHGRQLLPGEDDMDGFFYARLKKL